MKRIYITNGAWTQAVDFDPDLPGDIILVTSPAGHIQDAIQDSVEVTETVPQADTWVARPPIPTPVQREADMLEAVERGDDGANEKFMRELLGDDAYQQWLES